VLGAARGLVLDARRDVFLLEPHHALGDDRPLVFFKQRLVAGHQPRLDERGLGLHVGVGHLDAVIQVADGVADLQADVPERIQHAVDQPGQVRQGLAGHDLVLMQEHEINVAVRVQFRPAITADGHEGDRGEFLLRLKRKRADRRVPKIFDQHIQDARATPADTDAVRAGAMQQFQAVGLDLEEIFVARELFRRGGGGRKRQPRGGGGLDFFQEILHGRKS